MLLKFHILQISVCFPVFLVESSLTGRELEQIGRELEKIGRKLEWIGRKLEGIGKELKWIGKEESAEEKGSDAKGIPFLANGLGTRKGIGELRYFEEGSMKLEGSYGMMGREGNVLRNEEGN